MALEPTDELLDSIGRLAPLPFQSSREAHRRQYELVRDQVLEAAARECKPCNPDGCGHEECYAMRKAQRAIRAMKGTR